MHDRPAPSDPATVLLIHVIADGAQARSTAKAVIAYLEGLPVVVRWEGSPDEQADAWARLVHRSPSGWSLHLTQPESGFVWDGSFDDGGASQPVREETLRVMFRAAIDALLEHDAAAPTERGVESSAGVDSRASAFLVGVAYQGSTYAPEIPWLSGIRADLGWRSRRLWGTKIGYTWVEPIRAAQARASMEIRRHLVEADLLYEHVFRRWVVGGSAGCVLEVARRRVETNDDRLVGANDRLHVGFGVAARGRIGVRWNRVEFATVLGMEAWLTLQQYAVRDPAGTVRPVLTPRRVRLSASLGVTVAL